MNGNNTNIVIVNTSSYSIGCGFSSLLYVFYISLAVFNKHVLINIFRIQKSKTSYFFN